MRKALTLVELILSVVIISIVFTAIPKIIIATNQSFVSASKQDGIFNAMQLMHMIANTPFDSQSYHTFSILKVEENGLDNLECNTTTGIRKGGFVGGRHCLDVEKNATRIDERNLDTVLAIEDYHQFNFDANVSNTNCVDYKKYGLVPNVSYKKLIATNLTNIDLSNSSDVELTNDDGNATSHIKHIKMSVDFNGTGQSGCVDFDYYAANLGQLNIARRDY